MTDNQQQGAEPRRPGRPRIRDSPADRDAAAAAHTAQVAELQARLEHATRVAADLDAERATLTDQLAQARTEMTRQSATATIERLEPDLAGGRRTRPQPTPPRPRIEELRTDNTELRAQVAELAAHPNPACSPTPTT